MTRVVLAMIVKNEAPIIERCIQSVRPVIDAISICDTGSSDDTPARIEELGRRLGLTTVVHRRPWVNFGANRTESLELARTHGDYALMIDADEILEYEDGFDPRAFRASLTRDLYYIECRYNGITYQRPQLSSTRLRFVYRDVIHEWLDCLDPIGERGFVRGLWNKPVQDGARSRDGLTAKLERDAATLRSAVESEPTSGRYVFYLANTYKDLAQWDEALRWYRKRVEMGGWVEERFVSLLRIGRCAAAMAGSDLKSREPEMIQAWLDAFDAAPHRAESLWELARHFRVTGRYRLAYEFASIGSRVAKPSGNVLFLEPQVYDWAILDELSIAAYWVDRRDESARLCRRLLGIAPASELPRIQKNLEFAVAPR